MIEWRAEDGSFIRFERLGSQPGRETVLLLHGLLGSTSSHWKGFGAPLADQYQVIRVDLRGHGRSQNNETTLTPELILTDLEGLLDYLQVDRLHVAGYDIGGYLGLMLQLRRPERIASLLLHATKFYWPEHSSTRMRKNLDPERMSNKVPVLSSQLILEHGAGRWRSLVRQSADLVMTISENGVTESMARSTRCPVLVSVGDRDELVPLHEAHRLCNVFPNGALLVLPGVGHAFRTMSVPTLLPSMQLFLKSSGSAWVRRGA